MTRLTYKEKSRSLALILFLLILLAVALSSCGVNHHLRKSQKHLKRAIAKGAIVSPDTTWQTIPFISPQINFSTTFDRVVTKDTIIARDAATGSTTKVKIDLNENCPDSCIRLMTITTNIPPQEQEKEVPVAVTNNIETPRGFWYYAGWMAISALVGFILGAIFWAALRAWIKSFL